MQYTFLLLLSCVWLFATLWTVARQAPLSMGFPRQEYWSALPLPSPRDLPKPGIEPMSPTWQADSLALSHLESPCSNIEGLYQSLLLLLRRVSHVRLCATP